MPEAKELIDKGYMTVTIIQPTKIFSDQIFSVAINLVNNLNPTKNTHYNVIRGQIIASFPVEVYLKKATT